MIRCVLVAVMLWSTVLQASLRFEGNHHADSAVLLTQCRPAQTLEQTINQITELYVNQGYFLARACQRISGNDTAFVIKEGRQFVVSDLRLVGISDSLGRQLTGRLSGSRPLSRAVLETLIRSAADEFSNNGYPFAQSQIDSLDITDSVITLRLQMVSGPEVKIGRVDFPGIRTTKAESLRKRVTLHQGDLYRENQLTESAWRLTQLRHCYPDGEASLTYESRDRTVNIALPLRDERNLAFEGIAYLNPDNSVAGQAAINLINPFGRGEEFGFLWSRQDRLSRKLGLNVLLPYIADSRLDVQASLAQETRDSSFAGTGLTLGGLYHIADFWSLGAEIRWNRVTPQENQTNPSARILGIDLNSRFDRRDDIRQTRKGALITQHLTTASRKSFVGGSGVVNGRSTNLDGDIKLWLPLHGNLVVYQRTRYFQISSDYDPIPVDQMIPVGGGESLRGYREFSFLAKLGLLSATELRWYAAGNLMLHIFTDNGYIRTTDADRRLSGFGAGMVITTTAGAFQFDLSLGEEKKLGSMLAHFGFAGKL
jgi:outer membrane protein assembly factor BamA